LVASVEGVTFENAARKRREHRGKSKRCASRERSKEECRKTTKLVKAQASILLDDEIECKSNFQVIFPHNNFGEHKARL